MDKKKVGEDRSIFSGKFSGKKSNKPNHKIILNNPKIIFSDRPFHNKRGQITLFIIIGIVVLFAFAGIMYLVKTTREAPLLAAEEPVIAQVPSEFAPLQAYTENCLTQIGKRGLVLLGQQGGYIYPDLVGEYSASDPTDADGLDFEPSKIPYWHYNSESNKGGGITFASLQPKLYAKEDAAMSIEAQLGRFVEEKLEGCINQYRSFTENENFRVETASVKTVEVRIGEKSVGFLLTWDVDAGHAEAKHSFEQFYVKVPLKLKQMYEVAALASQAERNYTYIEQQALDLISIYSGTGDQSLPPTYDIDEGFTGKFWLVPDIEKAFQSLLVSQVPMLRFLGSANTFTYTYPDDRRSASYQSFYDHTVIPLDAKGFSVTFDYFSWPIYFYLQKEPLVKSQELLFTNPLGLPPFTIAMQRYRNKYDVSYPVLVSLRDQEALGGQGYTFTFALEANIRNNREVKSGERQIKIPPTARSQVCDTDKRTSELVKTIVVDSSTKEPIEMVRLGLHIPDEQDCFIDVTDARGEAENKYPLVLGGQLSLVKEGYLQNFYPINTLDYKEQPGIFGYAVAEVNEPAVELHPFKKVKLNVQKKKIGKCVTPLVCEYTLSPLTAGVLLIPAKDILCKPGPEQCFFQRGLLSLPDRVARLEVNASLTKYNDYYFFPQSASPLEEQEQAVVTLTRVGDLVPGVKSAPHIALATVQGNHPGELELVPGIYKVDVLLTNNEGIIIPKEERSIRYEVITIESEERFTTEETKLTSYLSGQVVWDSSETYLKITPEELYGGEELTVYVPSQELQHVPEKTTTAAKECAALTCFTDEVCLFQACVSHDVPINARVIEDLTMMGKMTEIANKYRKDLEPIWS